MYARMLIAAAAAAALAGCGGQSADDRDRKAEAEAAETAYTAPTATVSGTPAFAPAYPGGRVVANMNAVEGGRRGGVFAFQTADAPDKVLAFYRAKAQAAGLTEESNADAAGSRIYAAKGDAGELGVTIAPAEGQHYVQVTWGAD